MAVLNSQLNTQFSTCAKTNISRAGIKSGFAFFNLRRPRLVPVWTVLCLYWRKPLTFFVSFAISSWTSWQMVWEKPLKRSPEHRDLGRTGPTCWYWCAVWPVTQVKWFQQSWWPLQQLNIPLNLERGKFLCLFFLFFLKFCLLGKSLQQSARLPQKLRAFSKHLLMLSTLLPISFNGSWTCTSNIVSKKKRPL